MATGTQSYVVLAGDTLQGIAQRVYGYANQWYVLADANGLHGDGDLKAGQHLSLPEVTSRSNSADSLKPYNPGAIIGSTSPVPPPPQHCQSGGLLAARLETSFDRLGAGLGDSRYVGAGISGWFAAASSWLPVHRQRRLRVMGR